MSQAALSLKLAHEQVVINHFCSSQWNSIQQIKWFNNSMFNGMFHELKEVKYFKEITDFKDLKM